MPNEFIAFITYKTAERMIVHICQDEEQNLLWYAIKRYKKKKEKSRFVSSSRVKYWKNDLR